MPDNKKKGIFLESEEEIITYLDSLDKQAQREKAVSKNPSPPKMKKDGKYIDNPKKLTNNPILKWFYSLSSKKQKTVKAVSVILAITVFMGTVLGIFISSKFNKMGNVNDYTDNIVYDEKDFSEIDGDVGSSDFREALKQWATTGNDQKMSSKNVVNVLLIGADSRQGTNSGNTDVMMIVSLNKKTKTIKLVSLMRDSFLYINGKNSSYCAKLNSAFSMGGPECLMETIENNYKIEIDDFVMVNFESFKSIIDAMGGITVDVKKYEANYSNSEYNLSMPYGEDVTLTGEEALIFCRIRGCDADGDVSRTRRQRQVINAIIDRVKSASISDLNNYLDALLPYVYTGFSNGEVLSLGMKAITNGWANYNRSELQIPTPETRTSGSASGSWIWVVDYQLAAQTLQKELYGDTNIVLEDGRTTLIDIYKGLSSGSGSSGGGGSSTPITENSGETEDVTEEVSTTEATVTEELPDNFFEDTEDMGSPEEETEEFDLPNISDDENNVTEGTTVGTTAPTTTLPQ